MNNHTNSTFSLLSKFLEDTRLKPRLTIGFSVVTLTFIGVIALSYWNFVKVGHEIEEMEAATEELALAANIELQFLKMSRAAREFVQKGDDKSEEQAKKYGDLTETALQDALTGIKNQEHLKLVEEIKYAMESYESNFETVVVLKHEFDTLVSETLEPTADKMIEDLDLLIQDARADHDEELVSEVVEARKHAFLIEIDTGRLLFENKKEYAEKIDYEFDAFSKTLENIAADIHTEHESQLLSELIELRDKYHTVYVTAQGNRMNVTVLVSEARSDCSTLLFCA